MRRTLIVFILLSGIFFISCESSKKQASAGLLPEEEQTIKVFESASPSVVFIKNASLRWDWFSMDIYEMPQGAGSGFVWDKEGHVITNFHVIYQADRIEVTFADQKTYPAAIVGFSADHDLAVLKVDAPDSVFKPVALGTSKDLKVGQRALSISNPFGLDYSLTTGVVSALGRSIQAMTGRKIYDVIQTDAAINPGSSGGPLLNSSGELIGVSTAIFSPSGASAGIGFAIPVDVVSRVVPQLIKYGKIKKIGLGMIVVPDSIRSRLGLEGVLIQNIRQGGSADQAGLRPTRRDAFGKIILGDVIMEIDGVSMKGNEDLFMFLDKDKKAGDKINIKFIRDGKAYQTTAVLQEIEG